MRIDPQHIFGHAEDLYNTDLHLRRSFGNNGGLAAMAAIHSLATKAFCCELYLKTLICLETGGAERGHNLKTLFYKLHGKTQNRIKLEWDRYIAANDLLFQHWEKFNIRVERDFSRALKEGACGYEQLRYPYEGNKINTFFLSDLPEMLRAVIYEMKPDWMPPGQFLIPMKPMTADRLAQIQHAEPAFRGPLRNVPIKDKSSGEAPP